MLFSVHEKMLFVVTSTLSMSMSKLMITIGLVAWFPSSFSPVRHVVPVGVGWNPVECAMMYGQ